MDFNQLMQHNDEPSAFIATESSKPLVLINAFLAALYFVVLAFFFPQGNSILFWFLIAGEIFHLWQLGTFLYTIWDMRDSTPLDPHYYPPADVFITVAGEPRDILEQTIIAAKNMEYPDFKIHLLNDGYVAKRDNWHEAEELAQEYGISCITRRKPGGAKAGNINNALRLTKNPFVVIFDADHIPHKDFLTKMMPLFSDPKMGFVQSPQYYKNYGENAVTGGSWEQQELFFGAICRGKNRLNATTMCGTNMAIRRSTIEEVGGMCEESIAEDFATGLFMHQKGWKSAYVSEVLAEGLAPEDFLSYYKQQFRWARGALDVIFRYNLVFARGLTFSQKIQYLASATFYLSGIFVAIDAVMPLAFFFTGAVPFLISTMLLAAIFLPYIFLTLYNLERSSNYTYTFRSLAFSMSSFGIHLSALWSVLTGTKPAFDITSKKKIEGNFLRLVKPHLAYIVLLIAGIVVAVMREGLSASVMANAAWGILHAAVFTQFILAALPQRESAKKHSSVKKNSTAERRMRRLPVKSALELGEAQTVSY
jgi:cellulose synthase (UDP-forming)